MILSSRGCQSGFLHGKDATLWSIPLHHFEHCKQRALEARRAVHRAKQHSPVKNSAIMLMMESSSCRKSACSMGSLSISCRDGFAIRTWNLVFLSASHTKETACRAG